MSKQRQEISALKVTLAELEADFRAFQDKVVKVIRRQIIASRRSTPNGVSIEEVEQLIKRNAK